MAPFWKDHYFVHIWSKTYWCAPHCRIINLTPIKVLQRCADGADLNVNRLRDLKGDRPPVNTKRKSKSCTACPLSCLLGCFLPSNPPLGLGGRREREAEREPSEGRNKERQPLWDEVETSLSPITQSDAAEEVGARPSLFRFFASSSLSVVLRLRQSLTNSRLLSYLTRLKNHQPISPPSLSSLRRSFHRSKQNSLRMASMLCPNYWKEDED